MPEQPSWKDLIDMVSDTIKGVDENAKRENDKVCGDIAALREDLNTFRQEMNASHADIMLSRTEMANLRTEMSELKGEIKEQMHAADAAQCQEIELIKQQSEMSNGAKAKIAAVLVSLASAVAAIILKVFEYI